MRATRASELRVERERWTGRRKRAEERVAELTERIASLEAEIAGAGRRSGGLRSPSWQVARRIGRCCDGSSAKRPKPCHKPRISIAGSPKQRARRSRRGRRRASGWRATRSAASRRLPARTSSRRRSKSISGGPPDELRELAELEADAELPAADAMEARVHRLKNERERLGGVNLRAEEEAHELEARLDGMRGRAPGSGGGDQAASPRHPEPEPRGARAAARRLRGGERPLRQPLPATVRRRHGGTCS